MRRLNIAFSGIPLHWVDVGEGTSCCNMYESPLLISSINASIAGFPLACNSRRNSLALYRLLPCFRMDSISSCENIWSC